MCFMPIAAPISPWDAHQVAADASFHFRSRSCAFVDGRWIKAADGRAIDVFDPATGARIGAVPALGAAETERAIAGAAAAQPAWAARTALERAGYLKRWAALVADRREELALLMTLEQGK